MSNPLYPYRWASRIGRWVGSDPWVWLQSQALLKIVAACGMACLVVFLAFYNLGVYPSIDGDEGQHLLLARELALLGRYVAGPAVGPTVFFPVALAMRLFGVSLLPARLVIAVYLLLSVVVFYLLARQLGGRLVSLVATLLYVVNPGINLMNVGRKVVGEVPAALFMLAAILIWFQALDEPGPNRRRVKAVLCGVFLGFAILSKNQFLLLLPAWLALWVFDWLYYRQARHSDFFLALLSAVIVAAAWYVSPGLLLPNGQQLAAKNSVEWFNSLDRGILTLSKERMWFALQFLTDQNAFYGLVLPACLYAALRSARRSIQGVRWALLLSVTVIWLTWFTFLSVAWYRYAFPALILSAIMVAHFFSDATSGFRISWSKLTSMRTSEWDAVLVTRTILMALFLVIVARALVGRFYDLAARADASSQQAQIASYMAEHVPADAVIETFDPAICFLSGHTCHLPPGAIQNAAIKYQWYGGPPPFLYYHLEELDALYLLIGSWSRWHNLYDMQVVGRNYELQISIGDYNLYRAKTTK